METIGFSMEDDFDSSASSRSLRGSSQIPIDTPDVFEITLVDSFGGNKTVWDKPTITKEELQLYFPDTLGGIVDNDTRRPVREDTKLQAFVLKNHHSYEIRISTTNTKKSQNAFVTPTNAVPKQTAVREISNLSEDKENFLNGTLSDPASDDESEDSYDREDYGKKSNNRKRKSRPLESIPLNRTTSKDRDVPSFSNETSYTWSELIEEALRTLGGKRTGQEITSYIEENYSEMLSNKTKTWKNSVMGCLSSNARKLWIKEATVVDGKKRFVWCLKSDSNNFGSSQKHSNIQQEKDTPSATTTLVIPLQEKHMEIGSPFAAKALSRLQRGQTSQSKVKSKLFEDGQRITSPTKASLFLLSSLASSDSEPSGATQKTERNESTSTSPKRQKLPEDSAKDHPDDEEDEEPVLAVEEYQEAYAELIEECLRTCGASTGEFISDWISSRILQKQFPDHDKRKLKDIVDSVISRSPLFSKIIHPQNGEELWAVHVPDTISGNLFNQEIVLPVH